MKILFYRYGSICEPDLIEVFERLGLEVEEETAEIYRKDILPLDGLNLIRNRVQDHPEQYSFAFSINFFPWLSDVCNAYHMIYISLIVDSPVLELYSKSIRNPYNRVFLFDRMLYNEFAPKNPACVFHIPLATNQQRNEQVIAAASVAQKQHFQSEVSFIGSLYSEKCPFNKAKLPEYEAGFSAGLIEAQLKVYGYNFIEETLSNDFVKVFMNSTPGVYRFPPNCEENYRAVVAQQYISVKVAEQERIRALKLLSDRFDVDIYTGSDTSMMPHIHNRGFAKSMTEMPLIFNRSKINLNITAKSIRSGLSLRIFDVLGCGGFLLTNYQAELPEFFEPGVDLETYSSMEELEDKVTYYLTHDTERERIAQTGCEKIRRLHTYDTRVLQMLQFVYPPA